MPVIVNVWCPVLNGECRHCSKEGVRRKTRASVLSDHTETSITQEIIFGLYCGNYCDWIQRVKECEIAQKNGHGVPSSAIVWNTLERTPGQQRLVV